VTRTRYRRDKPWRVARDAVSVEPGEGVGGLAEPVEAGVAALEGIAREPPEGGALEKVGAFVGDDDADAGRLRG